MDNQNSAPQQETIKELSLLGKIKSSIYGPDYYQEVLKKDIRYSWGYFFKFSLIMAVTATIAICFSMIPSLNTFFNKAATAVVENYPSELEVHIEKGIASANVDEPYKIAFPQDATLEHQGGVPWHNALIIDTKHDFTLGAFKEYDALALLSKDSLVYQDSNGKISIQSLSQIGSLTITKETVEQFISRAKPYVKLIIPLMVVLLFVGKLSYFFAFYVAYLLIGALIIWAILFVKKTRIGYKKSYQMGLHLMTLPIILSLFPQVDWLIFSAVLAVITWINFSGMEKIKNPEKQHEDTVEIMQGGAPVAASKIDA